MPAGNRRKEQTMIRNSSRNSNETAKPPIAKLRLGLIYANIWQRQTEDDSFYSVSFERYRDSQGNWQSTHSYDIDDLLVLAKLADRAHTEIANLRAGGADE
jgi:hypothetical protein